MAHLVFQTAFPGDLFLSIPLIKRLRDWDPETPIVLACRPGLGDFFLRQGLVDEVIDIDKRSATGRRAAFATIRARQWDVVLVPHESVRTALWMSRVRARGGKISFKRWWNFAAYDRRVVKPMDFPDALRQLSLLTPLDDTLGELFGSPAVEALRNPPAQVSLSLMQSTIPAWAAMTLGQQRSVERKVFLAPGSVWATKRWTAAGYTQLARLILQQGFAVELVGSPAEKALCEGIADEVHGVVNRAGQTSFSDLFNLFTRGTALICNDSGAMHVAAAAGLPTVAIFGPTTLAQGFRPWQNQAVVVQRELACRPCGKHGSQTCPIGTHACMTEISAPQVLAAFESLVQHHSANPRR